MIQRGQRHGLRLNVGDEQATTAHFVPKNGEYADRRWRSDQSNTKPYFFHPFYLLLTAAPSTAKTTNAKTRKTAQQIYAKNNDTLPFAMYSQHASDRPTSKSRPPVNWNNRPPSHMLNRPRMIAMILRLVMGCGSGSPIAAISGDKGRGAPQTVQTVALSSPVVAHFGQNGIRFLMYPAVLPDNMYTSRITLGGNSKNLLENHVLTSGSWLNVQVYWKWQSRQEAYRIFVVPPTNWKPNLYDRLRPFGAAGWASRNRQLNITSCRLKRHCHRKNPLCRRQIAICNDYSASEQVIVSIATKPHAQGGRWGLRAQAALAAATGWPHNPRGWRNRVRKPTRTARDARRRTKATPCAAATAFPPKSLSVLSLQPS